MNNDLLTVQQLAEHYGVTVRTIRQWIADCEIDVVMVSTDSTHTNYYELSRCELAISQRKDLKVLNELSDASKEIFVKGLIVKDMSREQLIEVVREQQLQLEQKDTRIKQIEDQRDRYEDIAIDNAREYNRLLKYVPNQFKTEEQRAWERATPASSLSWMFRK